MFSFLFSLSLITLCNSNSIFLNSQPRKDSKNQIPDWSRAGCSCETTTWVLLFFFSSSFSFFKSYWRLTVCLSVSPCGLMYWSVLPVYLSVFQSVSPFVGESSPQQGPKCLKAHEDLTNIGLWSLFLKVFLDWSCWQLMFCVDTHRVPIYLKKKLPKKRVFPEDKEGKRVCEKPKIHHKPDKVACLAVIWSVNNSLLSALLSF